MINKLISKLRLPRYIELILGVLLVIVLLGRYKPSRASESRSLVEYFLPYQPLAVLVTIFLILVAARLLAGPPKDYSRFFYNLLVKLRRRAG